MAARIEINRLIVASPVFLNCVFDEPNLNFVGMIHHPLGGVPIPTKNTRSHGFCTRFPQNSCRVPPPLFPPPPPPPPAIVTTQPQGYYLEAARSLSNSFAGSTFRRSVPMMFTSLPSAGHRKRRYPGHAAAVRQVLGRHARPLLKTSKRRRPRMVRAKVELDLPAGVDLVGLDHIGRRTGQLSHWSGWTGFR